MSSRRIWIAGCALVMVASVALGWLLGASPLLSAASADGEAREAAQAQNTIYSEELAALKVQFEALPQLESELGELRDELPPGADQPDYLAQLASAAQRHGVQLTSITAADAVAYAPAVAELPAVETPPADAEAPAADAEAPAADADAEAQPAPVVAGAGVPVTSPLVTAENFVSIPVTLALEGNYGNVLDFVESVQKGTRLSAVTAFSTSKDATGSSVDSGEEGGAETPVGTDTVTGTVTVFIYVLLDPAAE
jgi:Tfp pilus assembly protein PilO